MVQKPNEVSDNHLDLGNRQVSSIFDQLDQTFQLPIPNNFQWLNWIFNLTVLVLSVIICPFGPKFGWLTAQSRTNQFENPPKGFPSYIAIGLCLWPNSVSGISFLYLYWSEGVDLWTYELLLDDPISWHLYCPSTSSNCQHVLVPGPSLSLLSSLDSWPEKHNITWSSSLAWHAPFSSMKGNSATGFRAQSSILLTLINIIHISKWTEIMQWKLQYNSREMKLQMNGIPMHACEIFIWGIISRESDDIKVHETCLFTVTPPNKYILPLKLVAQAAKRSVPVSKYGLSTLFSSISCAA